MYSYNNKDRKVVKLNVTKMPRLLVNFQKLDFFQRENNASVEPRKTR